MQHILWYCLDGYWGKALHGWLERGIVLCVIRVMLRRIYCYVLTQRVRGIGMHIAQGGVKHQLPIVAVIASGQLLQGAYLRTIVIRGEIPWSGVMHLWCWKGGRFANCH